MFAFFTPAEPRQRVRRLVAVAVVAVVASTAVAGQIGANSAPAPKPVGVPSPAAVQAQMVSVITDSVKRLVAQQRPGDPRGLYVGGDSACWRCTSGPAAAAAVVAQANGDPAMVSAAIRTMDHLIDTYRLPSGAFRGPEVGSAPNGIQTMMFTESLGTAYVALGARLDAAHRTRWRQAITGAADYIVGNKELVWYANGNIALGNAGAMEMAFKVSGEAKYQAFYEQAMHFAVSPTARWKGSGLIITRQPKQADGSDGAGYLTERGAGGNGFDADYTAFQLEIVARIWAMNHDPKALRLMNLFFNQLMPRVNTTTWTLETSNGTRHPHPHRFVGFNTSALYILSTEGGRSELAPLVSSALARMVVVYRDLPTYYSPGFFYSMGISPAMTLMTANRLRAGDTGAPTPTPTPRPSSSSTASPRPSAGPGGSAEVLLRAQSFPTASSTRLITDATAPRGKALLFVGNVSSTVTWTTRTSGPLFAVARASQCDGSPTLRVRVDGTDMLAVPVAGRYGHYESNRTLLAGTHRVEVSMLGDLLRPGVCDRNLYLDSIGVVSR